MCGLRAISGFSGWMRPRFDLARQSFRPHLKQLVRAGGGRMDRFRSGNGC
jgi:hypothetical protein